MSPTEKQRNMAQKQTSTHAHAQIHKHRFEWRSTWLADESHRTLDVFFEPKS